MNLEPQPAAARASGIFIGVLCGAGAAFGWAAGFVAAKHGISIGFSPADLAFDRFFWTGLLLMPMAFRDGVLVFSQPGALPAASLSEVIVAVRALDMDDVRRQITERTA